MVVLTGSPAENETELCHEIEAQAQRPLINLAGKTNLKQLLAALKSARLLIAPDSGPTHMAVTVDTPVVGLYTHSNPRRTGPYPFLDYVVSGYEDALMDQYGKTSRDLRWGIRAKGAHLMQRIEFETVRNQVDRLLNDFHIL